MKKERCEWVTLDPLYIEYHDKEWGRPVFDDQHLFEMLILEGAQAGLNWLTVLKKRENYRAAFDRFVIGKVARYDARKIAQLLKNPGIIRNQLKIKSAVANARVVLAIQKEYGSFANYLWNFVNHQPIVNRWSNLKEVPAKTSVSDALAKDLKKRGCNFVGSTICYAFMQAVGMVNDHTKNCFCSKDR